ncbi:hypothetical protein [Actinoplanes sp. NPDC026670]|uniref:hypothetical protein n=1 Tax=Actinoplanes sp. NPDC026670 TaxID=3154700 RepID=UPI0033E706CD
MPSRSANGIDVALQGCGIAEGNVVPRWHYLSMPADPQQTIDYAPYIRRTLDGADRPMLVEQLYARWSANIASASAPEHVQFRILNQWPAPGQAWETLQEPIQQLVAEGSIVMCTNTDPAEHPEYHLTQGHDRFTAFFSQGPTPLVLRYLATPQGSIAWRGILTDRERAARHTEEVEQKWRDSLREAIRARAGIRPVTVGTMAFKYSCKRHETRWAINELIAAGRLQPAGKTLWGASRWEAVPATEYEQEAA